MHQRADRRARVLHQDCQAARHLFIRICATAAPAIEWVDRRQLRIQNLFELTDRFLREFGQRHMFVVGEIDHELPLATGIMQRHEAALANGIKLGEKDQGSCKLFHIAYALYAVVIEQCIVSCVIAGYCARMRFGQLRGFFRTPDFYRNNWNPFVIGLLQCGP